MLLLLTPVVHPPVFSVIEFDSAGGLERDRPEQAGGLQGRILLPQPPGSESEAARRAGLPGLQPGGPPFQSAVGIALAVLSELFVANEPVDPEVHHADLEGVAARA